MKESRRVIIVGANQGALALAEMLGRSDFDVTVFEKKRQEDVSYDWHDIMSPSAFGAAGLPMPPSDCYTKKKCWAFVPPGKNDYIYVGVPDDNLDISVERRPLNAFLYGRAKDFADFHYGTEVASLIIEGLAVKGIELASGERVSADLVVDASGARSALRGSLPQEFGIQQTLPDSDTFFVYRAFFDVNESAEAPQYTNKLYMKHMGEQGVAWFIFDKEKNNTDVLIGRVGRLSEQTLKAALDDMRADNPKMGKTLLKGGQIDIIPVRQPISKMVAAGYALLGNSAFMTIPMMGSGMACSLLAARFLADTLTSPQGDAFGIENLYRYQVRYMKEIGARHAGTVLMKNWMLSAPSDVIDFFMRKRIIGEKELGAGNSGQGATLSKRDVFIKVVKGFSRLPELLRLKTTTDRIKERTSFAAGIPEVYDKAEFEKWRSEYDS